MGDAVSTRWAQVAPNRPAIVHLQPDGAVDAWSFGRLDRAANQCANALRGLGVARGDRVGVLLGQTPETAIVHIAAYKLGAIALPLFTLFGEDGIRLRAGDAGARAIVTDAANLPKLAAIRTELPALETVLCIDGVGDGAAAFWEALERASDVFASVETTPEDPAVICYTSGTTGPPKGALLAHRMLLGHLPGVQMFLDGVPAPGDVAWTPADWAWLGGLGDMLLPSLYYGVPVVAHRMAKFDPEAAFALLARFDVTISFMPPTALKLMRGAAAPQQGAPKLRAVGCGGEALGAELLDWARGALGVVINEFYGQTECNLVTANSARLGALKPGSIGPATPGFVLAVLDPDGAPLGPGETGEIAIRRGAGSMFLGYWGRPEATADKFVGDWMRTGDQGWRDDDGYHFFDARADDVISSAGYRIGPSEIEDCLCARPEVSMAGVIGAPDALRGQKVVAFVVLRAEARPADREAEEQLPGNLGAACAHAAQPACRPARDACGRRDADDGDRQDHAAKPTHAV